MVKGVNKNVIEINDTGSEFFERIVFYVSPRFCNLSAKRLLKETDKFTFDYEKRQPRRNTLRRRMIKRRRRFVLGLCAAAAAVIYVVLRIVL